MASWKSCWIALFILEIFLSHPAAADIVCPDSSYTVVNFGCTYNGTYRNGQPYDYVTVVPDGSGETFAATGITIRVYLRNCQGQPLVGVPAERIVLFDSRLCICPGGNIADAATDTNGCTTFSGTLRAGGRTTSLTVFADGVSLGSIPVKINSPDNGVSSPCFVDAGDDAFFFVYGNPTHYGVEFDYNEDGVVDLSDLAIYARHLGAACR